MNKEELFRAYRMMHLIRATEERIGELVEAKEVHCPCHLYIGQEAIAAGVCAALEPGDTVWGGHRSHGHYLGMGGSLPELMAEIFGKVGGCSKGRGGSMHLFADRHGVPGTVPLVAATIPLAVGAGLAFKLRRQPHVSVSFLGDGATEEGHFHESINFAALEKLPVLFVCENNFYASHLQLMERRPVDNLDQIGALYGVPGVRLDGNDAAAVHEAAVEAVRRARGGEGPSFLECRTFRWRGHVGPRWDMDVGVTRRDELKEWIPRCPLDRTKMRLLELGYREEELAAVLDSVRRELADAEAFARNSPLPHPSELLDHVFCNNGETP
jgi:acetoin:2,6-dichlorophenolindophenol oxidoreductase subunit alpha